MNKFIFIILSLSCIYNNDQINNEVNEIYNGNYKNKISNDILYEKDDDEHLFLMGLIEIDGEKSKDFMERYLNTSSNKYEAQSILKIAEYYYAKGLYIQSSQWYKKIPLSYQNSKYRDVAIKTVLIKFVFPIFL